VAVGRTVAADYFNAKVLDRLGMYERRIEGSLYRTMKELQNRRLIRKVDGGHSPPYKIGPAEGGTGEKNPAQQEPMTDSAEQTQSPAVAGGHCPPDQAESLSCETNPIPGSQSDETPARAQMATCRAEQRQFPGADASPCHASPGVAGRLPGQEA
jgi:hypothetical protein